MFKMMSFRWQASVMVRRQMYRETSAEEAFAVSVQQQW